MNKAQYKAIQTAIARLQKLHSELVMISDRNAVQAAIDQLRCLVDGNGK
ncbi:MAG: hypothetical protein KDA76_12095 [Planctomycetaceae bacterium]|nr:hypothetical protein [Planctomycetaceae bacterium]